MRWLGNGLVIVLLTFLTQVGGLAWVVAMLFRFRLLAFAVAYAALWGGAMVLAPHVSGRVALPCFGDNIRAQSPIYCVTLRHFVTPELRDVAEDAAKAVAVAYPGSITTTLDGGFPFWNGFPLLPHLSHDDGEKLDFAFYYRRDGTYLPGRTKSAIGYWAFEVSGDPVCPAAFPSLRWGLSWLQPMWPDLKLDTARTRDLIEALSSDPRIKKIFVEPPLAETLGVSGPKIRFQGCRAARHDDHIHVQL